VTFLLIGFVLVRTAIPGPLRFCRHDLFRLILGAGIGAGIVSCCLFLSLAIGIPVQFLKDTVLVVGATAALTRCRTAKCTFCCANVPTAPTRTTAAVGVLFVFVLLCTMGIFLLLSAQSPHGAWDAWAIHNLHARFLFRGATHWTDVFDPELGASHPDYPLLLPAFIASEWKALGSDATGVPRRGGVSFYFRDSWRTYCLDLAIAWNVAGATCGCHAPGNAFFRHRPGAGSNCGCPVGLLLRHRR
jgi:hypothetical protein